MKQLKLRLHYDDREAKKKKKADKIMTGKLSNTKNFINKNIPSKVVNHNIKDINHPAKMNPIEKSIPIPKPIPIVKPIPTFIQPMKPVGMNVQKFINSNPLAKELANPSVNQRIL
jgi:hypothetical protein